MNENTFKVTPISPDGLDVGVVFPDDRPPLLRHGLGHGHEHGDEYEYELEYRYKYEKAYEHEYEHYYEYDF